MDHLHHDITYSSVLEDILVNGVPKGDRTGTGTCFTLRLYTHSTQSILNSPVKETAYTYDAHEALLQDNKT